MLILANCDFDQHSKGYYSDLRSSLSLGRQFLPSVMVWIAIMVPWFALLLSSGRPVVNPPWVNAWTGSVALLGIEPIKFSSQECGETLFYDFAGQSQYHGPHQSFLEAMMNKPEVSVTLLLLVKAVEEEDIITQQLHRWLQPLAQRPAPCTQVIVIGSFSHQVQSVSRHTTDWKI